MSKVNLQPTKGIRSVARGFALITVFGISAATFGVILTNDRKASAREKISGDNLKIAEANARASEANRALSKNLLQIMNRVATTETPILVAPSEDEEAPNFEVIGEVIPVEPLAEEFPALSQ